MTHDFAMTIVVDDLRSTATIAVSGDFDAGCVERFDASVATSGLDPAVVVFDLTATTIIDSAAIGALIRLAEICSGRCAVFETLVERPFQIELFEITGLVDFLGVHIPS